MPYRAGSRRQGRPGITHKSYRELNLGRSAASRGTRLRGTRLLGPDMLPQFNVKDLSIYVTLDLLRQGRLKSKLDDLPIRIASQGQGDGFEDKSIARFLRSNLLLLLSA